MKPGRRRVMMRLQLAAALLLCWSGAASAAGTCTISAVGLAFGTYDPANPTPDTALGSVAATCNWTGGGSTQFTLTTRFSAGNAGVLPNRHMLRQGGSEQLNYNIYLDAGLTLIGGDGTAGTAIWGPVQVRVSNGSSTETVTGDLYGQIPAGQSALPGDYTDTITVTLTF
jgi:spore coat protein U-like protein